MANNTSANAVTSGAVKLSNTQKNRPSSTPRSAVPSDEVNSLRQQLVVLSTRLEKYEAQCTEKSSTSIPAGSENQTSTSASRPPPPASFDQPSTSTPLFGLPAVTIPAHSAKPETQLCQRNILWTSVTSAGEPLPLPLDSCCSVSLVSKVHADLVASKRPDLKYCALEEHISVTSADSKSDLKAVATMKIPITWENETETVFTMLVVPGFVWPMLFGENHLHATQALVDHYATSITFRHPSMQFRVQCSLDNPLQGFANISVPNSSSSCASGSTSQKPHVSITCLLTGAPPLGVLKHSQSLYRGLNFVTVCVTLSAALMGYQVMRQPLWIEGKDVQPGVKVLSGPFDLSQISSHVKPETARPSSDRCYNAHNVSPIPGTGQISPFFYLKKASQEAPMQSSLELNIAEGKQVYVRRPPPSSQPKGSAIRFIRRFDGPYTIIGHVHGRQDLLRLRHKFTQDEIKTVNIEKIIVVPDELSEEVDYDLRNNEEPPSNTETVTPPELPTRKSAAIDPDLAKLAFALGHYLNSLPGAKAYASEACKVVYQQIPDAQEILKRCGKLKGLISKCPYLSMSGGSNGGTYLLKLDKEMFATLVSEN
ncbi:hypothetical protein ACROYT_G017206 [Oculina patagonica]